MALFSRGSTPCLSGTIAGLDLSGACIYATISQGTRQLTKSGADIQCLYDAESDTNTLTIMYAQEDTLALIDGPAEMQLRWIFADGRADGSEIERVSIGRILKDGVITYVVDPL